MDDWNKKHHTQSGLLFKIPSGKSTEQVEEDLLNLVKKHWPVIEKKDDMPILCGNSIAQDRAFINKYFSNFASKLHYRMLDVTAWKIVFNQKFEIKYEKKNSHRAIDDLNESLEELRLYLKYIKLN
jgi:oligoribonuclease